MSKIQALANEFIATRTEKSFKKLMDRLTPGILSKISQFEDDNEKRYELLNLVFARAWKSIEQYDLERGHFSTWIYKIAQTTCLLDKRHSNRTYSLDKMIEDRVLVETIDESVTEDFDTKENFDIVDELYNITIKEIYNLPTTEKIGMIRSALIKWHIDKKSYAEIADELTNEFGIKVPENTAKNKVFRGKKILKDILNKKYPDLVSLYNEYSKN